MIEPQPQSRSWLFLQAVAIGLLTGAMAVCFRTALQYGEEARSAVTRFAYEVGGWGVVLPVLFSAVAVWVGLELVYRIVPEAAGSGIPNVEAYLHHDRDMTWYRVLWVKFVGGVLSIGGGLALGREGPTVQMGAALAQLWGRLFRCSPEDAKTFVAVGAGAGLAGAFNAPLAGMLFVVEELRRASRHAEYFAALLATTMADLMCRNLAGQKPVFGTLELVTPPLNLMPFALAVGAVAGGIGVLFNHSLLASINLFDRMKRACGLPTVGIALGASVGLLGWLRPELLGGGEPLIEDLLIRTPGWGLLVSLLFIRWLLTLGSYASGAPGGLFAPLLVLGAVVGLLSGNLAQQCFPQLDLSSRDFVILGMGALFTGIVRAPVTGVLLMIEMTGNYSLILPLLFACLTAYLVAEVLRDPPIYEALLARMQKDGHDSGNHTERPSGN